MAGHTGFVMADWLALNGIIAADCQALVREGQARPGPDAPRRAANLAYADPSLCANVIAALARALPPARAVLARIGDDVRIDLAPDPARFPRAFTLHDDGRGLPFISCPLTGRVSDILLLAHELGHACQIIASGHHNQAPILRETAACLAEELVVIGIEPTAPAFAGLARDLLQARKARMADRDGRALLLALTDPDTPYSYGWNYPPARALAARAVRHLADDGQWGVFSGDCDLAALIALPPD